MGMALTQASELSNSRIINRDCRATIEEILCYRQSKSANGKTRLQMGI